MSYLFCKMFLSNPVPAEILALAGLAAESLPDAVKVVGGGIYQLRFVGEDSGLEVTVIVASHPHARSCEVGRTDIGGGAVENHYLEMHPWAESPFQPAPQAWILVEVLAEVLAWFFGVQQTHIDTPFQQLVEHRQERHHIPTSLHIQILQVGSTNPQIVLDLLANRQHLCVMFFVRDVPNHLYFV